MKKITTLEQVAQMLLNSKVSFMYTPTYVGVTNADSRRVFETATYHAENHSVVFMDNWYAEVSEADVMNYYSSPANEYFFDNLRKIASK